MPLPEVDLEPTITDENAECCQPKSFSRGKRCSRTCAGDSTSFGCFRSIFIKTYEKGGGESKTEKKTRKKKEYSSFSTFSLLFKYLNQLSTRGSFVIEVQYFLKF